MSFTEQDFQFAEAWRPQQRGDIIQGSVQERSERDSGYGPYPIVVLKVDEEGNEVAVHAFHTALKNQIEEQDPQPGDYCGILFQGKVVRDDADDFFSYRVRVKRGGYPPVDPVGPPNTPADDDEVPF